MSDETGAAALPKKDDLPRSLGHVMRVLRVSPPEGAAVEIPNGSYMRHADLAKVLASVPGRQKAGRQYPSAVLSDGMIGELERSERFDVWKIARYANWSGVPVSVIMLVQELAAHLRDNKADLAKAIAAATIDVCNSVLENSDRLAGQSPGPGNDLSEERRSHITTHCRNRDGRSETEEALAKNDKFYLIADELFRRYPVSALDLKRAEWRDRLKK